MAEDAREQVVEVVGHAARHDAEALQLLGLEELALQRLPFRMRAAFLRHIPQDELVQRAPFVLHADQVRFGFHLAPIRPQVHPVEPLGLTLRGGGQHAPRAVQARFPIPLERRTQGAGRDADDLVRGPPQQDRGRAIDEGVALGGINEEDRLRRIIEELAEAGLARFQVLGRALLVGHIHQHAQHRRAAIFLHGAAVDFHEDLSSVLALGAEGVMDALDLPHDPLADVVEHGLPVRRRDEGADGHALHLRLGVAEDAAEGRVRVLKDAILDEVDAREAFFHERAVELFGFLALIQLFLQTVPEPSALHCERRQVRHEAHLGEIGLGRFAPVRPESREDTEEFPAAALEGERHRRARVELMDERLVRLAGGILAQILHHHQLSRRRRAAAHSGIRPANGQGRRGREGQAGRARLHEGVERGLLFRDRVDRPLSIGGDFAKAIEKGPQRAFEIRLARHLRQGRLEDPHALIQAGGRFELMGQLGVGPHAVQGQGRHAAEVLQAAFLEGAHDERIVLHEGQAVEHAHQLAALDQGHAHEGAQAETLSGHRVELLGMLGTVLHDHGAVFEVEHPRKTRGHDRQSQTLEHFTELGVDGRCPGLELEFLLAIRGVGEAAHRPLGARIDLPGAAHEHAEDLLFGAAEAQGQDAFRQRPVLLRLLQRPLEGKGPLVGAGRLAHVRG